MAVDEGNDVRVLKTFKDIYFGIEVFFKLLVQLG